MVDLTDEQIEAAGKRGDLEGSTEPRALSARYNRTTGKLVIELRGGSVVHIPANLLQGLEAASAADRAKIEILGMGYGLHWPKLDADFTVPGLLAGIFGTRKYMAKLAGQAKSKAKAEAARKNGRKGGRPPKSKAQKVA